MAETAKGFILQVYTFSPAEEKIAKTLNMLQIQMLHTKRATLLLQKAAMPCPESVELDRSYLLQRAELDGKINLIQELFDDHTAAEKQQINAEATEDVTEKADKLARQS